MTLDFVVIRGERADYAFAAELVREVLLPGDWNGAPPLALGELLPADALAPSTSERLLVIRAGASDIALLVTTEIAFRQLDPRELLALPPLLRPARGPTLVSGLAFTAGQAPLVVLNPAAFPDREA